MKSAFNRSILALAAILVVAGAARPARSKQLKSYQSGSKEFWTHPPDDWFLGDDETEGAKGPRAAVGSADRLIGRRTRRHDEKDQAAGGLQDRSLRLERIGRAADGLGRQGHIVRRLCSGLGNVYAITDVSGKKEVKTILKGLNMPTGLAFRDGALYVIAVDKLIKYDNAEANLDKLGDGKVVYDGHAALRRPRLEIPRRRQGRLVLRAVRTSLQHRDSADQRVADPARRSQTGNAELVALGVRNSVGGDVDPRTRQILVHRKTPVTG